MLMDEGMDTGAILLQEKLPITPDDTTGTLAPRLAEMGGRLLVETLAQLKAGTLMPKKQDDGQATMAPIMTDDPRKARPQRPAFSMSGTAAVAPSRSATRTQKSGLASIP